MSGERFSLQSAWEGEEVDLFGHTYVVLPTTKARAAKLEAAEAKIGESTAEQELVDAFAAVLDLRLKPVGDETTKASTRIKKGWTDGEIGIEHLTAFWHHVSQVATLPPM